MDHIADKPEGNTMCLIGRQSKFNHFNEELCFLCALLTSFTHLHSKRS